MLKFLFRLLIINFIIVKAYAETMPHNLEFIIFQQHAVINNQHKNIIRHFARLDKKNIINYNKLNKVPDLQLTLSKELQLLNASTNYKVLQYVDWEDVVTHRFNSGVYFYFDNFNKTSTDVIKLEGIINYKYSANIYGVKIDIIFYLKQQEPPIRLTQSAKIKKGELFYFDNPNFGVLLKLDLPKAINKI